jgi:hypothetical protein
VTTGFQPRKGRLVNPCTFRQQGEG